MAQARRRRDLAEVSRVGVDETVRAQGLQYMTGFKDLEERRIGISTEGKDAETVNEFKAGLEARGGPAERVEEFCQDLPPVTALAKTMKRHWNGVARGFQTEISHGFMEGMNRLIQAANARPRGYRSVNYFITMI